MYIAETELNCCRSPVWSSSFGLFASKERHPAYAGCLDSKTVVAGISYLISLWAASIARVRASRTFGSPGMLLMIAST